MALLKVHCRKCGENFQLDIGKLTIDEAREHLAAQQTFECPGHHVELTSPLAFWDLGEIVEGSAPSEEEWLASMREKHGELISPEDLRDNYGVVGFSMGVCIAVENNKEERILLDFGNSPSGKRYYWRL